MTTEVWILLGYLLFFALVATAAGLSNLTVHWGKAGRGSSGVRMSKRSKLLFAVAAWAILGMVGFGIAKIPWASYCSMGFFLSFIALIASAIGDYLHMRKQKQADDADAPVEPK